MEEERQTRKSQYISTLRKELLYLIERELSPLALKYCYSEANLENSIKWKPIVLILGNYSSGKSTLINDFIGTKVQLTGQAPTDDCFTVITGEPSETNHTDETLIEERDGNFLLSNPNFPFEHLKQHGDRFAAHFRYLKVDKPALYNLCIIDTPGMLDSDSEKSRGFDYQEVIGDLAHLADLILVLFDSHKAGTVREAYQSLRETLPAKVSDDRLIFVLNRADECVDLEDLLRVHGTLCWNLAQITERKDIPHILMTCSEQAVVKGDLESGFAGLAYASFLEKQRKHLYKVMESTPKHRLDHLASYVEYHAKRIAHLLEAVVSYNKAKTRFLLKTGFFGSTMSLLIASVAGIYIDKVEPLGHLQVESTLALGLGLGLFSFVVWQIVFARILFNFFHMSLMANLDKLTPLSSQGRLDSWVSIIKPLTTYLTHYNGSRAAATRKEWESVKRVYTKGAQEIRTAINTLGKVPNDPIRRQ